MICGKFTKKWQIKNISFLGCLHLITAILSPWKMTHEFTKMVVACLKPVKVPKLSSCKRGLAEIDGSGLKVEGVHLPCLLPVSRTQGRKGRGERDRLSNATLHYHFPLSSFKMFQSFFLCPILTFLPHRGGHCLEGGKGGTFPVSRDRNSPHFSNNLLVWFSWIIIDNCLRYN